MLDELPVSHIITVSQFHYLGSFKNEACQCIFKSLGRIYCGFLEYYFLCWLTYMPELLYEGTVDARFDVGLAFCAYPVCPACLPSRMPVVMMPSA